VAEIKGFGSLFGLSFSIVQNLSHFMIHTTAILAMSADGKLTDYSKAPSSFVSKEDQDHLETQVALADAVLFGAGTLRAYGTTMTVRNPDLLQQRQDRNQPEQPLQIVCSKSAELDSSYPFFSQATPGRYSLTQRALKNGAIGLSLI
jgi:5-amino-6-(5-phosphoribosylamino)uracil reductase